MKKLSILFATLTLLFSCKKDDVVDTPIPFNADHGGVYISNEGNFQSANATLTYFNPANKTVTNDPYKQTNKQTLGDICQSMNIINNKLYIVVNNSGKIEVCDPYSMTKEFTISGLTSPRYILPLNNTKAFVSDAYSNHISVINLNTHSVSGTITLNGWTEQMLLKNNKIYVTNISSDYLYIINPDTDVVADSVLISKGASSILTDFNGKIWVLCGGDYLNTYNASLYGIDPSTDKIDDSIIFASGDFPSRLCINGTGDSLYFLNNGIYKMSIDDHTLPVSPFIASSGNNFYGLAIDKIKNEIYVSDAIDYIQKGKVYRFHSNGSAIDNFLVGIIPGDFLFLP